MITKLKTVEDELVKKSLIPQLEKAIDLATNDAQDIVNIRRIGVGWTADETLALALYCSLKYSNCFEKAIQVAITHDGDIYSVGCVVGAILGATTNIDTLPNSWLRDLENIGIIRDKCKTLYNKIYKK